jgi:hypothetical protein
VTGPAGEPGTDPAWQALASASAGPRGADGPEGPRGPEGPVGPQGPAGPRGTSGDQLTFPSPTTRSFSSLGRRRISDAHVTPTSVVVVQYTGEGGSKPTSVSEMRAGGFVALGSPGRHFKYVVFDQP